MEFLDLATWVVIGRLIVIDILLAGDNAVVIGIAASKLNLSLQKKAILWGTLGAIILRLLFATLLVEALSYIPALHIVGGAILLWIAIQLLVGDEEPETIQAKSKLLPAIATIVMADAMMSIDNVLAVVGASQGHLAYVVIGMLVTVPLVVYGSTIFAKVINRYPIILYVGGMLLGWVGGEMMTEDRLLEPYIGGYELWIKLLCIVLVLVLVTILKYRRHIGQEKG